ncbi:MAG: efflux RND transporter periplasmic adaptor subunit [Bacteroidota bacterium]|nr:efflux RND transporter periplasmic adaptor subunit [Bacteroidota bacterium]
MSKSRIIAILGVVILVGFLIYLRAKPKDEATGPKQGKPDAGGQAAVIPVSIFIANDTLLVQKLFATGTLIPNESVELRNEVAGQVERIYFKEGSKVKKGALLVKIRDDEWQAQLSRINLQIKQAENNEARERKLLAKDAVSREAYENTVTDLNIRKAERQLLHTQIAKTSIRAPFDGIIGLRQVSEGTYLAANSPIAKLVSINPLKVDFSIPEKYSESIKTGDIITFTSNGPKRYDARIYAIEPGVDLNTRTLSMRATLQNDGSLTPGAFVSIELANSEFEAAITIPTHAIVPGKEIQSVFVMTNGKATPREVVTGLRSADRIQIVEGVSKGDTIITSGLLQIRPGMAVKPTSIQ